MNEVSINGRLVFKVKYEKIYENQAREIKEMLSKIGKSKEGCKYAVITKTST